MRLNQILNNDQILLLEEMNSNLILFLEAELQQSDEEPDYSSDEPTPQDAQNQANQQNQGQNPNQQSQDPNQAVDENGNPIPVEPEPSHQELFMYELEGAEDKFIQMILYNRLIELDNKVELLQLSVQDGIGVKSKYFYDRLNQYKQYIEVLNELIFSISTATIYKLVGQIELELVELLNEYTLSYNDNLIYDEAREAKK